MTTIKITNLNKIHGTQNILKNVTFEAKAGRVTAFLGHNGAGKSSTMRILLDLDYATSGEATFNEVRYSDLKFPLKTVGAAFDGIGGVLTRKVKTHLKIIAQSNEISNARVEEVIQIVGLTEKANAKLGTLSLGEGQRLGIATALLGNPQFIVLDEPTNGLDPSGIQWFREFIVEQKNLGKTILVSSHQLSEVELIADDIVIIHKGEILLSGEINEVKKGFDSLESLFFSLTKEGLK